LHGFCDRAYLFPDNLLIGEEEEVVQFNSRGFLLT